MDNNACKEFLAALAVLLADGGMAEKETDRNIRQYGHFLTSLSPEERAARVDAGGGVEGIASSMLKAAADAAGAREEALRAERVDRSDDTHEFRMPPCREIEPMSGDETDFDGAPMGDTGEYITVGRNAPLSATRQFDLTAAGTSAAPAVTQQAATAHTMRVEPVGEIPVSDSITRHTRGIVKQETPTSPLFWVLLVATLPLTLPIALTILGLFLAAALSLAVIIVGLFAALVTVIAGGSVIALIGIIYGITQTGVSMPVGVYEIGLGIAAAGVTMLAGVLIYNAAVRFIPFVLRWLGVFFMFTVRRAREFFYYVRRECAAK